MSLYRGAGGASDATDDSTVNAVAGYASAAASSASSAATSATNASNSATAAASSASGAASSASSVATNAANASSSAGLANTYATAASNSKDAAAASAVTASTKAGEASTSASNAATSAATATTQATNASNSASAAATSASNASTSATNAASSAADALAIYGNTTAMNNAVTAAAASASNAATSAAEADDSRILAEAAVTGASSYASAAQASSNDAQGYATAALSARDAAFAAYDSFDDRYLGVKSADPTVDNDGNQLVAGSLYFNDQTNMMMLRAGGVWVAAYTSGGSPSFGNTVINGTLNVTGTATFSALSGALAGASTNSVVYTNGSSVLSTGNALKFNGSVLSLNGASSAWNSIRYPVEAGKFSFVGSTTADFGELTTNVYFNSSNQYIRTATTTALRYRMTGGVHSWSNAVSGSSGTAATFIDTMTLDASGNLGIGVTPSAWAAVKALQVSNASLYGNGGSDAAFSQNAYYNAGWKYISTAAAAQYQFDNGAHKWFTAASGTAGTAITFTQAMTLDASGNLLVGTTSAFNSAHTIFKGSNTADLQLTVGGGGAVPGVAFYFANNAGTANAANSVVKIGLMAATARSISAGGTINASGADYAEYMTKAGDFTVAKGDVVGIDANGKLTNVFADAVSFVVKSTDPSYVGGDVWGIGFDNDPEGLEAARQSVDRIAFAGQVPVNVTGASAGQFIIPVNDNGAIKGEAVSSPTFEQYQLAVGKVIAIEADGRARIIVKMA